MARWDRIIAVRDAVNGELERARADKTIGKGLEARVSLTVPAEDAFLDLRWTPPGPGGRTSHRLRREVTVAAPGPWPWTPPQGRAGAGGPCPWGEGQRGLEAQLRRVGEDHDHPTLCPRCPPWCGHGGVTPFAREAYASAGT